jgi:aspartate aminotransferase
MPISKRIEESLEGASWIRRMFEEGERLKSQVGAQNVYDFTLGNPFLEPPDEFRSELLNILNNPYPHMHGYMSNAGYIETRTKIAGFLKDESGLEFNENHIIMSCGAAGGLNVVLKSLLDPGDEVIVLSPFFMEYIFYIYNHSGIPKVVETDEKFNLDLEAIERGISDKTKAIIINSPNNPTGNVYDEASLKEFAELLDRVKRKYGNIIYLISDEAYKKIVYDGIKPPNIFKLFNNSIVVTSHSKDLSIPGERIGYIAINPEADDSDKIIEAFVFSNRVLGFVNAPALMQRVVGKLQNLSVDIMDYQNKRDLLYSNLKEMGFDMIKPKGAFYLFPKSPIDDVEFVKYAQRKNILIVPGKGFGRGGYFRIAYCVDKEVIERSLDSFYKLAKEFSL